MDIKTKFNVGERVFTINMNTFKVKVFEIGCISTFVREDGSIHICYTPKGAGSYSLDNYEESKCFASKEELLSYINSNEQ